jgi:signal transduction histidine kinase/NO-binding membrane sensor protein with MHYT domain/CheY-like chemotaxis protein
VFKVLSCIAGQHDLRLVLIAALTCVTASFTAFRIYAQGLGRPLNERLPWLVFTGLTAGAGVWATHFIAMLAYAPAVKSGYDLAGTVGSLLLSILGAGLGFGLATVVRRRMWKAAAGLIAGLSIGVMHFTGMLAFHPSAHMIWDKGYVVASLILGAGFGAASVAVAGRDLKSIALASGLYTLAVCGLHFTGMTAVTLLPDPRIAVPPHVLSNGALAGGVAGAASLIFLLAGSLVTLEGWSRRAAISHLKDAIEPMAEGIAYFDADDRIITWNTRYAELVDPAGVLRPGKSFTELLQDNVSAGAHPEAIGRETAWVRERVAQRNRLGTDEHKNGERWVRAERRRTRDGGLVTVVMDVTEFRWAQEVLAQARDAAEAANRAKSEFLANVSHELRTPLNGVLGIAEVLTHTALDPRQREMVETIRTSGADLEALLSDIMDLARLESGKVDVVVEPFNLAEAVRTAAAPFQLQARGKRLGFVLDMGPDVHGVVEGDAARLRQILANLISNAVKFTDRGEVRIAVDRPAHGEGWIRFAVKDTGVGFGPEAKARIFEHFQQGDGSSTRRHGGTGLGLAICKQAAELLGGSLDCRSTLGEGSEFTLILRLPSAAAAPIIAPRTAPEPVAEAALALQPLLQDNQAQEEEQDHALRVLVVDDHPTNRRVVEMILDQVGAERVSVENGLEALEAYISDHFDVVLMDIQMPVMDGLTATQKIRLVEKEEHRTPTPVIILSANAMPEHIEAGKAAGANRHLAKPISAAELLNVIAEVAGEARAA